MRRRTLGASVLLGLLAHAVGPAATAATPLFKGLGQGSRKISTASAKAQRYFDQGLALLSAFNHDEAIRSFGEAARIDPQCAMAHWGIALAHGPHINLSVVSPARAAAAWDALEQARSLAPRATALEQALIEALGHRYADRTPLDRAYAEAMRGVWRAHPTDPDVGAWFAEALMDLRPWDQWTPEGQPQPGTEEVLATLDAVLALEPKHALANHLYIHAVEASPHPERADRASNVLRDLQPGLGHLVHMPSHIDVRRGRWSQAVEANAKAVAADRRYRKASRSPQDFYRIYIAHNRHMLAYAAMMSGRSAQALQAARAMVDEIPAAWLKENVALADAFIAIPYEVLLRFGRFDDVLAEPEPPDYLPFTRAVRHAARGIAHAAQGDAPAARREQAAFAAGRALVSADALAGNNLSRSILDVVERMLEGELLYREGRIDAGLAALGEAIQLEDALRYDEPPGWILPVRHALGAGLMQAGRLAEAEAVYRDDLARLPENGWSLFGLKRSLELQGRHGEAAAVEQRFKGVWAGADLKLTSSCFCQPGR